MHLAENDQSRLEGFMSTFNQERKTEYRGERNLVRNNGAVYRLNPFRKKARPLDKKWSFGRQCRS